MGRQIAKIAILRRLLPPWVSQGATRRNRSLSFACLSWPRYDREYYTCRYNYAYNNRRTAARPLCRSNRPIRGAVYRLGRFDRRLYQEDSRLHRSRTDAGEDLSIEQEECSSIVNGLNDILAEITSGKFDWRVELEDVHMNIEHQLIERIGDTGKKLHTGRSRNDQIATDIRLYLRKAIDQLTTEGKKLLGSLATLALEHSATLMPGFTHLQTAQPITFGHHLMAWHAMLERDLERLADCRKRTNELPRWVLRPQLERRTNLIDSTLRSYWVSTMCAAIHWML